MNDSFIAIIKRELLGKDDQNKFQILERINQWTAHELNKLNDKRSTPYIERIFRKEQTSGELE